MRKGHFVFASLSTLIATVAQDGFVVTTSRAPITKGTFAGSDGVTLFIRNDGLNGSGTDILDYAVTLSTPGGTVNPRFYIRAWDGTIRNPNASANTRADFGYQGFVPGDATRNGTVDIFDFNALLPHFNSAGTWSGGDFNNTGTVDLFDFNSMLPNFNKTVQPGSYVRFGTGAQVDQFVNLQTIPAENSQVYTDGQTVTTFT